MLVQADVCVHRQTKKQASTRKNIHRSSQVEVKLISYVSKGIMCPLTCWCSWWIQRDQR
uniref:Uncharacterized protein n=1 Tax=Triticum urartu TaxID=4572 RepID=A0A8R7QE69_TRIUA